MSFEQVERRRARELPRGDLGTCVAGEVEAAGSSPGTPRTARSPVDCRLQVRPASRPWSSPLTPVVLSSSYGELSSLHAARSSLAASSSVINRWMSPLRRAARMAGAFAGPAGDGNDVRDGSKLLRADGNEAAGQPFGSKLAAVRVEDRRADVRDGTGRVEIGGQLLGQRRSTVDPLAVTRRCRRQPWSAASNMSMVLRTCGSRRSAAAISGLSTSIGTGRA